MPAVLYGVGTGPGDPELMTLKACRTIKENSVIAFVGKAAEDSKAYKIAVQAVPETAGKILVPLSFPMTKDSALLSQCHRKNAEQIESFLREGKNVVFLTLGDVCLYSTFSYIQKIVESDGFQVRLVSGVPSFCAAGAGLKMPLTEQNEPLYVIPLSGIPDDLDSLLKRGGTFVFMKAGSRIKEITEKLESFDFNVRMAENVGMQDEKLFNSLTELPEKAGYFSVITAKKNL